MTFWEFLDRNGYGIAVFIIIFGLLFGPALLAIFAGHH